jgi:hypothetical protein
VLKAEVTIVPLKSVAPFAGVVKAGLLEQRGLSKN